MAANRKSQYSEHILSIDRSDKCDFTHNSLVGQLGLGAQSRVHIGLGDKVNVSVS